MSKQLKTHLYGGCGFAPCDKYPNDRASTKELREVTCAYCKTKLLNELYFMDWSKLNDDEHRMLMLLRQRRDIRKGR